MARTQTIVQLTDELLAELDAAKDRRGLRSRSEAIRQAIDLWLAADRARDVDRTIVDGYTRMPPEDLDELTAASAATIIATEAW